MNLPLAEITVVVTRPPEQAAEFSSDLKRLGANVFSFPTIEIAAPESYADLDAAIENLSNYDWIIFTSTNAAEHFLKRLAAKNLETAELDYLRVAAVGDATAERLRLARVHIDVLPAESNAESLFSEIENYVGELADLHFLFPRSEIAREVLPQKLRDAGATVDSPIAYRTVLPQKPETAKFKAMLAGGSIDCITFASPSAFKNFLQIFSETKLPSDVAIACIGETTANAVRESGLKVGIVSPEATSAAFAREIAEYFR
ncbi:MAG: uroporphyrinogen-III synthase [Acidobacteriota bacterium]|nr:uroporphyrinogen-III synthase [Acidobacteriota bacterium]